MERALVARRPGAGRKQVAAPELPEISGDESLSLAHRVYAALGEGLMAGAVPPGSSLTSRSLSTALGVSATPVREALKQLEADGAITSRSKSAFYVNDPDQHEYKQILELRLATEGLAVRKAAMVATSADLDYIRSLNDEYKRILRSDDSSFSLSLVPNFRFHFAIYRLSRSPILMNVIETTWLRIGPALHQYMKMVVDVEPGLNAHEEMIHALERKDPNAAESALRNDLSSAAGLVLPELRRGSGSDQVDLVEPMSLKKRAGPKPACAR